MTANYPIPELERWQPLRSGLLNLYRYDREEFWFEKGRLLLRGNNGTGKSRVLALQFPFLLDGEISPRRVEPDADPAKRMEWNVLTDKYDNRTGYTWLEFGRLDADGAAAYCTIGCGLHAARGKGAPSRWFFVTRQRVGESLFLETPGQVPLTRQQLQEAVGGMGSVFTAARDYRRAVNEALYQLDEERYEALIELLIQLRQPQLSRQLDEGKLSDALSYSLPPLEESLIHAVAESFRQLEEERVALENDQRAVESVTRFLQVYTRYAERQVAAQAGQFLSGQSAYEKALRARNQAREALVAAERTHEQSLAALADAAKAITALETGRDVLLSRPELQDANRLTRAREDARKARQSAEFAERDLQLDRQTLARRQGELAQIQEGLGRAQAERERTVIAAKAAGEDLVMPREWEAWEGASTAEALGAGLRAWIRGRREAEAALVRRQKEVDQAVQREIRAQEAAARQREIWERAEEAAGRALAEHTRRVDAHLEGLTQWLLSLRVLRIADAEMLAQAQTLWCETLEGPPPLTEAKTQAESAAREQIAAREAALRQTREGVERDMSGLRREREELLRGVDPEPAPPRLRGADARMQRPGAPLWRLLEFREGLDAAECAGIEAALEAAGLLDAWLCPDGRLLEDSQGDVLLDVQALPGAAGPALDTLLQPDGAADAVAPALLQRLLAGIGASPAAGGIWVTPAGQWHQGALTGRAAKAHAEYLGASARALARQRRIAEIDQRLGELEAEAARLAAQAEALAERRRRLQEELAACPDAARVKESDRDLRLARAQAEEAQHERVLCDQRALAAREALAKEREGFREAAQDLRLGAWAERLDRLSGALHTLQDALQQWLGACGALERAAEDAARVDAETRLAAEQMSRTQTRFAQASENALRLQTEADTLESQVGKGIQEVQRQLEQTLQQLEAAKSEHGRLDKEERKQQSLRFQCQAEAAQKENTLQRDTEARALMRQSFLDMAATGILQEIEGAAPEEALEGLSLSALADWTRALVKRLPEPSKDPDAMDNLQRELYQAVQGLTGDLTARNLHPVNDPRHGLNLVRCEYQGRERGMRELQVILQEEALHRQTILKAKEKDFIERYLIDDIGDRLHHMILNAEELIHNMNTEMASRPMSTGLKLRLVWEPAADAPEGFREARKRLQRSKALLTAEDRRQLGDFLQERIAREKEENEGGTWREHLARAVDYRRWHRFGVERQQGGNWQKLTRRTHGTGSGGEKAVALTFPQFAAAAAHYHNLPHAPRLIFLDEAFVGIDSDMRGKCMGLLEHFDLDFVMTSEREWGCYAAIRGLAICQLAAMQGSDVVAISRWIWNGHARESAATPEPARPQEPAAVEAEADLFG